MVKDVEQYPKVYDTIFIPKDVDQNNYPIYRCYIYPFGCTRSQHITVSGHCQPASETPFKRCYA